MSVWGNSRKGPNCRNRDVVNVNNRLYSPNYDWEGDDGRAWSESGESDAMCFWGLCGPSSYAAWCEATDKYINKVLSSQYMKVLKLAEGKFGAIPIEVADRMAKIASHINSWNQSEFKKDWETGAYDVWSVPVFGEQYWDTRGNIQGVVNIFDDAACLMDELNSIASVDLDRPSLAQGAPVRTVTPSPTGSFLDGSGGGQGGSASPSGGGISKSLGVVGLGVAAYFGFKALTE